MCIRDRIYGDFGGPFVDRDQVEVNHFESWMQWAAENGIKLDFNSTSFSHPKSGNLSLAHPAQGIRDFWVEHTKRCLLYTSTMMLPAGLIVPFASPRAMAPPIFPAPIIAARCV